MNQPLHAPLEQAAKILGELDELPEYLSVAVTADGVWLTPWIHGAPITAVLAWIDMIDNPEVTSVNYGEHTSVHAVGLFDAVRLHVSSTTHRLVQTQPDGRVSIDELRRIASEEEAFETPVRRTDGPGSTDDPSGSVEAAVGSGGEGVQASEG